MHPIFLVAINAPVGGTGAGGYYKLPFIQSHLLTQRLWYGNSMSSGWLDVLYAHADVFFRIRCYHSLTKQGKRGICVKFWDTQYIDEE